MSIMPKSANLGRSLRLLASASTLAVVAGLALSPSAAFAQASSDAADAVLEELVVTAERRTVSLQQTSIAASALSSADLEKKSVENVSDLQRATPSLSIIEQGFNKSLNIRGIGLAVVSPAVVPGVATYRDGVFLPTQTTYGEPFFDIQSVEVLRGPQGTFVGQNSTGGGIFINSKSPTIGDGVNGDVSLGIGNYQNVLLRGAVNLPISDTLAARVAFNAEQKDSFYDNLGSSTVEPGRVNMSNLRLGLLWTPTESLSVLFKTQYNKSSTDGYAYKPIPGTAFAALAPADPFTINFDRQDLRNDALYVRSSLQVDYTFANGVKLRSNTGLQYNDERIFYDTDATAASVLFQTQDYIERIATQDISLISPDDAALRWVVGATYFKYTDYVDSTIYTPVNRVRIYIYLPKSSYGVFGAATYNLTPTLELQVGARYSADEMKFQGFTRITPGPTLPANASGDGDQWTGKVALNWKPNSDNLIYGFWAKGYKSGGANTNGVPFDPETVQDYEIGWKSTLLDGHLRTQLGAFYMKYDGFQAVTYDPTTTRTATTNATASTIKGFEAQAQLQFGGFGADASLAYVNSEMGTLTLVNTRLLPGGSATGLGVQCPAGVPSNPPLCFNYQPFTVTINGAANPYAPEWTGNVGMQYAFDLGDGTLTPRVDVAYIGSQWTSFFQAPRDYLAARTVVNLQLTYERHDWTVQGYATNVADKRYISGQSAFGDNQFYGAPRQFGVRVTRRF